MILKIKMNCIEIQSIFRHCFFCFGGCRTKKKFGSRKGKEENSAVRVEKGSHLLSSGKSQNIKLVGLDSYHVII